MAVSHIHTNHLHDGFTAPSPPVHHRQNRRRERPGSRTRRTVTRKANVLMYDRDEGLLDAQDLSVPLPSDKTRPSPLLRQNFDQSWQRWKSRQAEDRALAERLQMEEEQMRLCGGEFGDDELYRMGILYDDEENFKDNTVSRDVPSEHSVPMFVLRLGKPRRPQRRSGPRSSLPLYLSFSGLSDDAEVARLLSSPTPLCRKPTIQHRITVRTPPTTLDIPQSLPPTPSALASNPVSTPATQPANDPIPISLPHDSPSGDWTLITPAHTPVDSPTPLEEPETWVLIDDS